MIVSYLFDCRKVFLGSIEVINCNLIHRNIHYRTMTAMPTPLPMEVWLTANLRRPRATAARPDNATAVLLLYFLIRLENWRQ